MMYEFFDSLGLMELTEQAVVFRIVLATIFGGALGLERTRKRRAAGFRTYILVCIGATVVMMTGQFVTERIGGSDPARLGAQVISGIGFLGAGTILVTGAHQIKGLTTAAGLWSAACMGIALGIGFYFGAFVMVIAMLLVMTIFDWLQTRWISKSNHIRLYVVFENLQNITDFLELAKEKHIHIDDFETTRSPAGHGVAVLFMLRFQEKMSHSQIIEMVRHCDGLISIEEI
ncbi:MgtC/SapB family protein [Christensenellaceae bacterium OttesenSCG-928-L17]|nr:MgtC/SapB family protein [Christensenellaceae bacterium OttesenSCG-928-L17]